MKNLLILFSVLLSFSSLASISMVSDFDDTIKITNSGQEVDGTRRVMFSRDSFMGMTEFFSGARIYIHKLHILSASPNFLNSTVVATLKKGQIKYDSLILRNLKKNPNKFDFKVNELKKLLEETEDSFILVGDDVGQDPEIYEEIRSLYPNRILAVYIHVITNRAVPDSSQRYWTSFDLLLYEYFIGRMSPEWVSFTGAKLLLEKNMKLIFPVFAHCPTTDEGWAWQSEGDFSAQASRLQSRWLVYCQARQSTK